MKKSIHPNYQEVVFWDTSSDFKFLSRSTNVPKEKIKFTDGKEYPVKGTYANETVSLKQLGDRSIEATFKRDGKIVSVDKITVSPDGKKMTSVVDNKLTGRVSTYIDEKQ